MGRSFSLFRPRTKARSHAATKKCPTRAHSSGHSVIRIHCTDAAFHCGEGTLTYHLAGLSSLQVASQEVVNQGRITRHFHEKAGPCQAVFLGRANYAADCRPTGGTISLQSFLHRKFFCSAVATADRRPAG